MGEGRAKLQLLVSAELPSLIAEAAARTGRPSSTRYIQEAICGRLSYDLDIAYEDLVAALPRTRMDLSGFNGFRAPGSANTVEDVR